MNPNPRPGRSLRVRSLAAALLCGVGLLQTAPASSAERSLYAIGNSLTASILPHSMPGFASQRGQVFNVGFYTYSGAALDFLVANPSITLGAYPVTLSGAFQGFTWTDLSMEPYPSPTSTLASDIAAVQSVLDAAKAGTSGNARLFIYAAWPSQASTGAGGFATYWRSAGADELTQPSVLKRAYMDHLHTRLVAAVGTSTSVHVIPVGDVLAALDDLIRAGQVAGITDMSQLYTDTHHMGDVGSFIAAATVYATVSRDNPEGLAIPAGYEQGLAAARLTPALAAQLESLVWRVVNADPRTGVNSAPVATPQSLQLPGTAPLRITLHATDTQGSTLTYTLVTQPTHGQLQGSPPQVTYTPDAGYHGTDSFTFTASDGAMESAVATVTLTVPQAPVEEPEASGGGGGLQAWSLLLLAGLLAWRSGLRGLILPRVRPRG